MGSGQTPNFSGVTAQTMRAYLKYIPQILQATSAQQPGIDRTQAQSATDILNRFSGGAARTGQQIIDSNTGAGTRTVGNQINGQGGDNVINADALNRAINPEYYATRTSAADASKRLIDSINLNGLSPGESNAVERGLNQTNTRSGNLGLINPTNVVSNAMNFGNAMAGKRAELSGAINTANNLQGNQQSTNFANIEQGATFQPPTSTGTNFGLASLPVGGSQAFSSGQGLQNNLFGSMNTLDPLWQQHAFQGSAQGYAQSVGQNVNCCFILLEALNGKLPWHVRVNRDRYYVQYPEVASGYKRMAKWLVPMMRRNGFIRKAVNWLMVKPIVSYSGWLYRENKFGWLMWLFKPVWFAVWRNNA